MILVCGLTERSTKAVVFTVMTTVYTTATHIQYIYMYICVPLCHTMVGGMAQWQEHWSRLANFPCCTLELQLIGDHLVWVNRLLEVNQPGQLNLSFSRGR